ncbi:hydrolethalus syndrome protein 1 homolog [Salarias fasciatus]|uniref:Centriolar and ciliogenesis-associated protein HYLS1 C-terminal domain-containing protein n=1 Tax=Salarias fasciatus TaxID=181472 RepID=A0A672G9P4_SALFA|nr:hydrolethalus syndrome protein 1 [Salarias fasciatus]
MDPLDFSEEEIQQQLLLLGYKNVPKARLLELKRDLDELIRHGEWRSVSLSPQTSPGPSPPAFTKEKVRPSEAFVLHAAPCGDGQPLLTHPCRDERPPGDSYARHSVAPAQRLAAGAPCLLTVEDDPDTLSHSPTTSLHSQERRFIRRKVMRKLKGQRHVCDESVYSEDSDGLSCLEQRLAQIQVSPSEPDRETDGGADSDGGSDRTASSAAESCLSSLTGTGTDGDLRPQPKSFIRPAVGPPVRKSDPVARYFQYKQIWDMFKCPGEVDRRALRWEIKERLAYQPPPPRPRRVYVPNTYVVPTEKKRSALRWAVRTELAAAPQPCRASGRF